MTAFPDIAPPARRRGFPLVPALAAVAVLGAGGWAAWHYFGPGAEAAPVPAPAPAQGGGAPPVQVVVQTVQERNVRIWSEFSGRLHAVDQAEIRPEVSGRIDEVRFVDGQNVKAGDVLFVIDPRPFEAALARAQAHVASATANVAFTKADLDRNAGLLKGAAIAQREYDQAKNAYDAAAADLQSAQAEVKTAQVDVDHAYVKAPIAGRVSRAELTVGNLVQSGAGAPLLTSVVAEDAIYADFEVDEQTYLETIRDAANGNAQEQQIPVKLLVQGDRDRRVYEGFIQSFDNRLDTASGTIRARARFVNDDRGLVPGMFVSVKLASSRERTVLVVPERAIGSDQSKKFAFVVDGGNKVAYRELELGRVVEAGQRIVEKGLQPGDRVVVDGVQHVRPDAVVVAQEQAQPRSSGDGSKTSLAQGEVASAK